MPTPILREVAQSPGVFRRARTDAARTSAPTSSRCSSPFTSNKNGKLVGGWSRRTPRSATRFSIGLLARYEWRAHSRVATAVAGDWRRTTGRAAFAAVVASHSFLERRRARSFQARSSRRRNSETVHKKIVPLSSSTGWLRGATPDAYSLLATVGARVSQGCSIAAVIGAAPKRTRRAIRRRPFCLAERIHGLAVQGVSSRPQPSGSVAPARRRIRRHSQCQTGRAVGVRVSLRHEHR